MTAVEGAQPHETTQHVGQIGAENAPVGVNLVNDDIAQVFKQLYPLGVVGENAAVQHVRVGNHNVSCLPDGFPGCTWRVPVIGVGFDVHIHFFNQLVQLTDLIGRQCLGGEQIQCPGILILQNGGKHRKIVAHGFAGGGGSDHHHVLPGGGSGNAVCLMGVQLMNPTLLKHGNQPSIQRIGERSVLSSTGRKLFPPHYIFHECFISAQLIRQLVYVHVLCLLCPMILLMITPCRRNVQQRKNRPSITAWTTSGSIRWNCRFGEIT